MLNGLFFICGIINPFFEHARFNEFDKNANSFYASMFNSLCIELVWRLSEFAFFMRLLLLNEYKEVLRNGDTMGFCSLYRLIVY